MRTKKIIAFFLLIAVLLMPVAVFADVPMPDPPYDAWQFWVVAQSWGKTILFTSQSPIKVEVTTADKPNKLFFSNMKQYNFIDNEWVSDGREFLRQCETSFEHIYASNHNIAKTDGSGFFFTPPKVSTLSQIVRQAKSQGTFGMMWRIILGGLIPLVGCLILGISLRKGWAFLRNLLMH
jgi:hypothetical protein